MPAQALSPSAPEGVLPLSALAPQALETLLGPFGLVVIWIEDATPIPGSYWGEREAGLQGDTLLVRRDTPVHSALHEAGHWLCMDPARRDELDTDAGGCGRP